MLYLKTIKFYIPIFEEKTLTNPASANRSQGTSTWYVHDGTCRSVRTPLKVNIFLVTLHKRQYLRLTPVLACIAVLVHQHYKWEELETNLTLTWIFLINLVNPFSFISFPRRLVCSVEHINRTTSALISNLVFM